MQPTRPVEAQRPPMPEAERVAIREQLERILANPLFRNSKRYPNLLRYIVEHTLDGHKAELKERTLGVEVFGRNPGYDTNADPIVRATAARSENGSPSITMSRVTMQSFASIWRPAPMCPNSGLPFQSDSFRLFRSTSMRNRTASPWLFPAAGCCIFWCALPSSPLQADCFTPGRGRIRQL